MTDPLIGRRPGQVWPQSPPSAGSYYPLWSSGPLFGVRPRSAWGDAAQQLVPALKDRSKAAVAQRVLDRAGERMFVLSPALQAELTRVAAGKTDLIGRGTAEVLNRMVDAADDRRRANAVTGPDAVLYKNLHGGRAVDVGQYAGARIHFEARPEDQIKGVGTYYRDLIGVDQNGNQVRGPVETAFSLLLPRNPRTDRRGARRDAEDHSQQRKQELYKPRNLSDKRKPLSDGIHQLRDSAVHADVFFDRDEEPLAPEFWKNSVAKSIGLLQPAAQAEMRRIRALDTTHRLRALAPDGIDHMHAQEETPKPRVNFAFNADSWADSGTRLQARIHSVMRTMTEPTPAESILTHANGLTPKLRSVASTRPPGRRPDGAFPAGGMASFTSSMQRNMQTAAAEFARSTSSGASMAAQAAALQNTLLLVTQRAMQAQRPAMVPTFASRTSMMTQMRPPMNMGPPPGSMGAHLASLNSSLLAAARAVAGMPH